MRDDRVYGVRISIHAPHTRGDVKGGHELWQVVISTHAPHTRGDPAPSLSALTRAISTHAPHTRGDPLPEAGASTCTYFNPRPSYEGRHSFYAPSGNDCAISTHAPHTRGDLPRPPCPRRSRHFNPRPSYEGRRLSESVSSTSDKFQPTPLIRGATQIIVVSARGCAISTHAVSASLRLAASAS